MVSSLLNTRFATPFGEYAAACAADLLFDSLDDVAKLELLVDFGERLLPLSKSCERFRDAGLHMIHECQSPVFLFVEVQQGTVRIHADVPREAPIARGFTVLLCETFDGVPVTTMNDAPADLLAAFGLRELLSMQRRRGLSAIYRHLRRGATLAFDADIY